MQILRAIARALSSSASLSDTATDGYDLVELTIEQLDHVSGGGGHPPIGTSGFARIATGGGGAEPYGGKPSGLGTNG
jgi:hypothetical protein